MGLSSFLNIHLISSDCRYISMALKTRTRDHQLTCSLLTSASSLSTLMKS